MWVMQFYYRTWQIETVTNIILVGSANQFEKYVSEICVSLPSKFHPEQLRVISFNFNINWLALPHVNDKRDVSFPDIIVDAATIIIIVIVSFLLYKPSDLSPLSLSLSQLTGLLLKTSASVLCRLVSTFASVILALLAQCVRACPWIWCVCGISFTLNWSYIATFSIFSHSLRGVCVCLCICVARIHVCYCWFFLLFSSLWVKFNEERIERVNVKTEQHRIKLLLLSLTKQNNTLTPKR